jgi:hypothetical protein
VDGTIERAWNKCEEGCYFTAVIGKGDHENLPITGVDPGASRVRASVSEEQRSVFERIKLFFRRLLRL